MKNKIPRVAAVISFAGAMTAVFLTAGEELPYLEAALDAKKLVRDYTSEEETDDEGRAGEALGLLGRAIDFQGLREMNEDITGWIFIPGTPVDYPILQHPDNNTYYLYHAPDGSENIVGSIYLYAEADRDFTEPHTILFGHNMASGQQFGRLSDYADKEFRDRYPYVYIYLPDRAMQCEIYSVYSCTVQDDTYTVGYVYGTQEYRDFIAHTEAASVWEGQISPGTADPVITLSTCTDGGDASRRFVVNCVVVEKCGRGAEAEQIRGRGS